MTTASRLPRVGLNVFIVESFRAAAGPLFERGLVDALEWDLDHSWGGPRRKIDNVPGWAEELLDLYSDAGALYGHGVWYSPLTARWQPEQARWLAELERECARRDYVHVSEHFGFFANDDFVRSTLLPVPYTPGAVRVGRDRLARLQAASGTPVGLECSAVALHRADAEDQGAFLEELLAPLDGFVILDLHNVWTQAHNLGLDAAALMARHPLPRVRELHVSGGSWYHGATESRRPFRLDSHDGPVPDEAMALVPLALRACPNVELVILEQRGVGIESAGEQAQFRDDFVRLRALVEAERG
jgi:uncharacterized protein (UPF0276 family)